MKLALVTLAVVLLMLLMPSVQAQNSATGEDAHRGYYADVATVTGITSGGDVRTWIEYPSNVISATQTFPITGFGEGPTTVTGSVVYMWIFSTLNGCTAGTVGQSTLTAFGVNSAAFALVTMTSNFCSGILTTEIQINSVTQFRFLHAFYVRVIPTAFTNALSGIPDTQQETQAIADALNAGLDVTICPELEPCYNVLSGAVNTNSTVNATVNSNSTVESDVSEALADWIPLFVAFAILAIATMRRKPNYLSVIISGVFFVASAFLCPWPDVVLILMVGVWGGYLGLLGALETRNAENDQAMEG